MTPALPTKTDIFGICTAVGRDVGFHADILRVAFAVGLFVNPVAAVGAYALLGLVVLAARRLFPDPPRAASATIVALPAARPVPEPRGELRAAA